MLRTAAPAEIPPGAGLPAYVPPLRAATGEPLCRRGDRRPRTGLLVLPPRAAEAGSLAAFLCERYHLYASAGLLMRRLLGVTSLWRGTIAHAPWPLQVADASVRHSSMMQAPHTYSPPVVRVRSQR